MTLQRRLDALAVVAGLTAAIVLAFRAPGPPDPLGQLPRPAHLPVVAAPFAIPTQAAIRLHTNVPPRVSTDVLARSTPIEIAVSLPPGQRPAALRAWGVPLADHPLGGLLSISPSRLEWGLNILHLQGADRSGRPVDRAFPLLVGETTEAGAWIEPAVTIRLTREGFVDDDDLDDDLSAIARGQVAAALSLVPPLEAGPLTASHFRASRTEVLIVPGPGQLAVSVDFHRVYMDLDVAPVEIDNLVVNRMWVDAVLTVEADSQGRPRLQLQDISPHIDLVQRTEGFWNWVLDHAAWFLEIAGELMAEGPLREAVTSALDEVLRRWVSALTVDTVAPLAPETVEVAYRFAEIAVDDDGLRAELDVRFACEDGARGSIGRLAWPERTSTVVPSDVMPRVEDHEPLRIGLSADGANGALHALWRCGALDTTVAFERAHDELPLIVPADVRTRFEMPPIFQSVGDGALGIGVGGLEARIDYEDAAYEVTASGHLPVTLTASPDGRGLRVGFDPSRNEVSIFTDCLTVDSRPCRDNALFDRLAWLALPFLPPVGAEIPIPDVRLPDSMLVIRLGDVHFDPVGGQLSVGVSYEVP